MVVDPSALLAIVFNEADGPVFREAILASDNVSIAAPSAVELVMVRSAAKARKARQ
jgi:uncharacterized protein with PIN domain